MSQDELERIKVAEAELMLKLSALRREKEEVLASRRREEQAEKERTEQERQKNLVVDNPVTITVVKVSRSGTLTLSWDAKNPRQDFRAALTQRNNWTSNVDISEYRWEKIKESLLALPNLTITWTEEAKETWQWILNAPNWLVDVEISGKVTVKPGPKMGSRYKLTTIPGARWDFKDETHRIPAMESWRIPQALEDQVGVVYTDAAQQMIFSELERRNKLNLIAKQEDSEHPLLQKFLTREVWSPSLRENLPFWKALRPFQRVNVEFALANGGRLLNGDDTGLGKTWEALAFSEIMRQVRDGFQTLIIAKAGNIPNWRREIENLTGFEAEVITSGQIDGPSLKYIILDRAPYVIVSYDTLGSKTYFDEKKEQGYYPWAHAFLEAMPNMVILDEAHQIKNADTHRFKAASVFSMAEFVVPMTASPVLNRTTELWTLLHMIRPEEFDSQSKFENQYTIDGRSPRNVETLHELIRPIFLRRKKADVLKDLPPINRIYRFHDMSDRARATYERAIQGLYISLAHYDPAGIGGQQLNIMSVLSRFVRLKQIAASDKVDISAELAVDLTDNASNGGKVLLLSQFKGTCLAIAQKLGAEAVCTVRRTKDGFVSLNAVERDKLFESVRHDPKIKYICTVFQAADGITGHNLEFCDWVITNDLGWTPEAHRQNEGRCYGRLSNPHPIDSYYILAETECSIEIDKWVMELIEAKLSIIEQTVEGVEASRENGSESIAKDLIKRVREQMLLSVSR